MPPKDEHISVEKLEAIAKGKQELSRGEFEHIHVCAECLQAYAKAIRQRAKKSDKGKGARFESSDLVLAVTS
jgi:hypothetical protein